MKISALVLATLLVASMAPTPASAWVCRAITQGGVFGWKAWSDNHDYAHDEALAGCSRWGGHGCYIHFCAP